MKVSNVKINDLRESLIAAGYPMIPNLSSEDVDRDLSEKDVKRGSTLASTKGGGHDQFLTGILVSFDLTCTNKMWVEMERYRFVNFVSSQSTMHRIAKMNIDESCNEYVAEEIKEIIKDLVIDYNQRVDRLKENNSISQQEILEHDKKEAYLRLLYNIPSGFELTARLTTNYRALRNVYHQRKNHRLPEWRAFCKWIETLPYAKEFIIGE